MLFRENRPLLKLASYRRTGELAVRVGAVGAVGETTMADLTDLIGARGSLEGLLALEPSSLRSLVAQATQCRPLNEVELLPPIVNPPKIFCVGKNSRAHREELTRQGMLKEDPQEPTGFVKLVSTMVGEGAAVRRPEGITSLDYEPELAFVVSRPAYQVARADALSFIGGITLLNDLTARAVQRQEVASGTRFWTAKNMPGFCPVGPVVIPLWEILDPYDLWLTCTVNGEKRLRVNTNEHIFRIDQIIEHFTRWVRFEPGDVISTGAPRGTAISHPNAADLYLKPGDSCVAGLEGLMELTTRII
jgi:2-keto-4-pentenoate hydratase/2-oxohepta-3-ene-1,7-dioic acid hydratase in catechol pathway